MTPKLLTAEELAEIVKREKAATEGPWQIGEDTDNPEMVTAKRNADGSFNYVTGGYGDNLINDNTFVAHARTDIPALLAHISALDARWKEAEHAIRSLTPNGSEFVDDIEACVRYLKEQQRESHRMKVDYVKRCHDVEERCKELEGALRDATVLLKRGSSEIYVIANSESFSRDCKAVLESLSALEGGSR